MSAETFNIKANCLIVAAFDGPEVYDTTVVINPLGTDLTFPADGLAWADFMQESIGKVASVVIYCPSADMEPSETRENQFDAYYTGDPDEKYMKRGFRAVGQIIGHNGEKWAINSIFPIMVSNDSFSNFEPSFLGQWVEVGGMLWANWEAYDVIDDTFLGK